MSEPNLPVFRRFIATCYFRSLITNGADVASASHFLVSVIILSYFILLKSTALGTADGGTVVKVLRYKSEDR
jgi:hypothetical protein